jgi:hypothetical protein
MFSIFLLLYYFITLCFFILLYYFMELIIFILSEVCTRLRHKSVALMFFPCECKIVIFYPRTCQNFMSNHQDHERRENQKSMSLPSITETKNATLLRTRIVILAARYTATSLHFCNSRPEDGGRHPQLTARPTAPDLF